MSWGVELFCIEGANKLNDNEMVRRCGKSLGVHHLGLVKRGEYGAIWFSLQVNKLRLLVHHLFVHLKSLLYLS